MTSDTIDPRQPRTEIEERGHPTREDEIRRRAYEIYLDRGAQTGRELEDWLQAERELTAEQRRAEQNEPSEGFKPDRQKRSSRSKTK